MGKMEFIMPTYTIKNVETEEEWDVIQSWSQLEKDLEENPNWKQVFKPIKIVSGSGKDIFARQPESFKDLKNKMHKHAGSESRIKV